MLGWQLKKRQIPKHYLAGHDVEEFFGVVRRWGANESVKRLTDYLHVTSIREVPEAKITDYATYSRKQVKSNAERLARHEANKGRYSYENSLAHYQQFITTTDLPYIQMLSLSTSDERDKKRFKLFIEKRPAEKSETQVFSTYGLSSTSSVPKF